MEDVVNNSVEQEGSTEKETKKSKMPFSKKMYLCNFVLVILITIVSFCTIGLSGRLGIIDLSPISVIITSAYAELATHTGFYIWKAKYENGRKYRDVNLIQNLENDTMY